MRHLGGVTGSFDLCDQFGGRHGSIDDRDLGPFGGVVHRCCHTVELLSRRSIRAAHDAQVIPPTSSCTSLDVGSLVFVVMSYWPSVVEHCVTGR